MKPFIIIDLPMNHHEPDCTFCIKPGWVLTPGKPRYGGPENVTCLHDGIHNNGGWPIRLPIDELRKLLMEAFQ